MFGPSLDSLGWCGVDLAPCSCKPRRFTGCDWIEISPGTAKVFVRMLQSVQVPKLFVPNRTAMQNKLYREGCDSLVAEYNAWQRDANGYVGFYFDDCILAASAGYYVGDVFLGCDYCFSLKFRLAPCELIVDDCQVENQVETCGTTLCELYPAIGEGTIGGVDCALPPSAAPCGNTCGAIPPYFDDSNPGDFEFDPCQAGCYLPPTTCDVPLISPVAGTWIGGY